MFQSFGVALAAIAFSAANWIAPVSTAKAAELAQVALSPAPASLQLTGPAPVPATPAVEPEPTIRTADVQPDDLTVYPTLAAAVAAQDVSKAEDEALRCLATTIYFESKGEPLAGQLAVAQVVMNRVAARRFGEGVCGVVLQRGQFSSFVRGGKLPPVDATKRTYRTALAVAKVAMAEAWDSEADEALYFNSRRMAGRAQVASIGNHRFYR